MIDKGKVMMVVTRPVGSQLVGDHASGSSSLTVANTFVFNEDGGNLELGGVSYAYTGYDDDASTITLSGSLSAAAEDGDPVLLSPAAVEKYAIVLLDGEGEQVECLIPHALVPLMAEGGRDPSLAETVTIHRGVDGFEVVNVLGEPALLGSAYVNDSDGDMDPDTELVYLDGPPTHYYYPEDDLGAYEYVDYDTMLAAAGPDWAAAVSGLSFDNGDLTIPIIDVRPQNYEIDGRVYLPSWQVPTLGRSCRVVVDDCVGDPAEYIVVGDDSYSAALDLLPERIGGTVTTGEGSLDNFFTQWFFSDPLGAGATSRQWQGHVETFGDYPAEEPADAAPWNDDPTTFQGVPMQSMNGEEFDTTYGDGPQGNGDYVMVTIGEPLNREWVKEIPGWVPDGAYGNISIIASGVRVERQ